MEKNSKESLAEKICALPRNEQIYQLALIVDSLAKELYGKSKEEQEPTKEPK